MAICYDQHQKEHEVDLLNPKWGWHIMSEEEFKEERYRDATYWEMLAGNRVPMAADSLEMCRALPMFDPVYPEGDRWFELFFLVEDTDVLRRRPLAAYMYYPALDADDTCVKEGILWLSEEEQSYFTKMLKDHLGIKEPEDSTLRRIEITITRTVSEKHTIVVNGDDYKDLHSLDKGILAQVYVDAGNRLSMAEKLKSSGQKIVVKAFDPSFMVYSTVAEWGYTVRAEKISNELKILRYRCIAVNYPFELIEAETTDGKELHYVCVTVSPGKKREFDFSYGCWAFHAPQDEVEDFDKEETYDHSMNFATVMRRLCEKWNSDPTFKVDKNGIGEWMDWTD